LVASGRIEEAEKVLKKIEKINGKKTISVKDIQESLGDVKEATKTLKALAQLVRAPLLFGRFLIATFAW